MRIARMLWLILVVLIPAQLLGQTISGQKIKEFTERTQSGLAPMNRTCGGPVGTVCRINTWTTTLPVTFSRLDQVDGEWQLGASMTIGGAFIFLTGVGTTQADSSARVTPQFFIGPVGNFGVTQDTSGGVESSLLLGATMGFSVVSVMVGYDLLAKRSVIGLGTQIQTMVFTDKLTKIVSMK